MTDQQKKTMVVNAETDLSGKKQRATKIKGMDWRKLDGTDDPAFNIPYFLYRNRGTKDTPDPDFQVGLLDEIKVSSESCKYSWMVEGELEKQSHFTHFALCVKPVE